MLKQKRVLLMEDYIAKKGFVSMEELCNVFSISINTARADVRELVKAGKAQKAYGGVSCEQMPQPSDDRRQGEDEFEVEKKIGEAASRLINDGDIIFADVGAGCLSLVEMIPKDYHVTIITNSMAVLRKAVEKPNATVMTFGGTYQPKSDSFKCSFSALHSYINTCNISKAFFSTAGVSPLGALTDSENFARELRSGLIQSCHDCYLLADSRKFGKTALLTYGKLNDITACITDSNISLAYRTLCENMGTELIQVDLQKVSG